MEYKVKREGFFDGRFLKVGEVVEMEPRAAKYQVMSGALEKAKPRRRNAEEVNA